MLALLVVMWGLIMVGIRVLNRPFDPAHRVLPLLYFSFDWYWQPEAGPELKPRPEVWGGLLFALGGLIAYAQTVRGDRLARNLAAIGSLAGAWDSRSASASRRSMAGTGSCFARVPCKGWELMSTGGT